MAPFPHQEDAQVADTETTEVETTEADTPQDPPKDTPDKPADPPADDFDKDRAMATIAKLREAEKSGKRAEREAAELRQRLEAIEAEKLTDQEKVAKERDKAVAELSELRAANRRNAVKLAVFTAQHDKGIADAELALAALDHDKIEFGEDGEPTNVGDLLDELLERKPLLRGTPAKPRVPDTDGGAGGSDRAPDLTADELEAVRLSGSTPERYAAVKAAMGGKKTVSVTDVAAALKSKG